VDVGQAGEWVAAGEGRVAVGPALGGEVERNQPAGRACVIGSARRTRNKQRAHVPSDETAHWCCSGGIVEHAELETDAVRPEVGGVDTPEIHAENNVVVADSLDPSAVEGVGARGRSGACNDSDA